jgi:hypothetical protein
MLSGSKTHPSRPDSVFASTRYRHLPNSGKTLASPPCASRRALVTRAMSTGGDLEICRIAAHGSRGDGLENGNKPTCKQ